MQTPTMRTLRWLRMPGDTVFFLGAVALVWFVVGLKTGHSFRKEGFFASNGVASALQTIDAARPTTGAVAAQLWTRLSRKTRTLMIPSPIFDGCWMEL